MFHISNGIFLIYIEFVFMSCLGYQFKIGCLKECIWDKYILNFRLVQQAKQPIYPYVINYLLILQPMVLKTKPSFICD